MNSVVKLWQLINGLLSIQADAGDAMSLTMTSAVIVRDIDVDYFVPVRCTRRKTSNDYLVICNLGRRGWRNLVLFMYNE